jgi:hypothetical protein
MSWTYSVPEDVRDALVVHQSWTSIKEVIDSINYPAWLTPCRRRLINRFLRYIALDFHPSRNHTASVRIRSCQIRFESSEITYKLVYESVGRF